jgi:hypothetical protein
VTDRKNQPAQLQRRIKVLEGQLAAEKQACEKVWRGYRDALYELVEIRIRLETVEKALRGEL